MTAEDLEGFFVAWPSHPDPATHLEILSRSFKVWLALDRGRCVGFINALSDGVFYAHIPLLEVRLDYRHQGLGRELVERMVRSLDFAYAIDIVCDEAITPFYEKIGFIRLVAMVKRNYGRQAPTGR